MTVNEAHRDWTDILEKVAVNDEHIVLSKDGKEIAAIISMEVFLFLQRAIAMVEDDYLRSCTILDKPCQKWI
jgi:PHD/YefM family antitoxin component YafN of YafNO toxin-antitoxin module